MKVSPEMGGHIIYLMKVSPETGGNIIYLMKVVQKRAEISFT
jgi:hypothetical protein